jgi:hypothetical protein
MKHANLVGGTLNAALFLRPQGAFGAAAYCRFGLLVSSSWLILIFEGIEPGTGNA